MKKTLSCALCAMIAAVVLSGCASTKITGEWKNPEVEKVGPYKKIFLTAITQQEAFRRQCEDAFKAALTPAGAEGLPSYTTQIPAGEAEKDLLVKAVKESGADGALVIRLVKKETVTEVSPGYYGPTGYYGNYHSAWMGYYEPATVYEYEVITMEAKLFDVASEKLVWAVSTETFDPGKLQEELADYAKIVCEAMSKGGMIQAATP